LDVDFDQSKKKRTFEFDYVYPVVNLKRAADFYTPMLGAPVSLEGDRAMFKLGGARFILDATALDGMAPVEADLPNGYAVFLVDDVVAARDRLQNGGVRFVGGTETAVKSRNGDSYVVGVDPAGNLFVLEQQTLIATQQAAAPTGSGGGGDVPYVQSARAIAARWVATDSEGNVVLFTEYTGRPR
jgi:catechol 2,3-dioxygenase-like lactoylglutathione lyase family enzyme